MLSRILVYCFLGLVAFRFLFRWKWGDAKRWLDGVVNALLIAIALVYLFQLGLWWAS